jgi:homoserine O-succinyltransferase
LSLELPDRTLRSDIAAGSATAAIFRNWLGYLADGARAALPRVERGTLR